MKKLTRKDRRQLQVPCGVCCDRKACKGATVIVNGVPMCQAARNRLLWIETQDVLGPSGVAAVRVAP